MHTSIGPFKGKGYEFRVVDVSDDYYNDYIGRRERKEETEGLVQDYLNTVRQIAGEAYAHLRQSGQLLHPGDQTFCHDTLAHIKSIQREDDSEGRYVYSVEADEVSLNLYVNASELAVSGKLEVKVEAA